MKRFFVGFVFDSEKEQALLADSKIGVQTAANQYQLGFLSGIGDEALEILSSLSLGAYPRLNKRLIYKKGAAHTAYGRITYLSFINLPILRELAFQNQLYRTLSRAIRNSTQGEIEVFFYSLYVPYLNVLKKLKRQYGDKFRACLIIPDLPGKYGILRKKTSLRGIKDRLEVRKKMSYPNFADSFVFLTEPMRDLFANKPYTVIEGFLPYCAFNYENKREKKTVLYTGSLNPAYGITTLVKAFENIDDPEYRLWICGAGNGQAEVEAAAERDKRIEFKGFLPKSEIADLQTRCDVLINPRPADGEYTKYSFPSKTMEYLLSGSKVVMHKLDGIGDEYYRYIRVIDEHTPKAIADAIIAACADEEFYDARHLEQVEWINEQKTAAKQISKLMENVYED